jgi:hypothetical protein
MVTDPNGQEIKPGSKVQVPCPSPRYDTILSGVVSSIVYIEDEPVEVWVDIPGWLNRVRGNNEWIYGISEMVVVL